MDDDKILEIGLPIFLENDIKTLKEGIKNNVSNIDCLENEVQGSVNSAWVDGLISDKQKDYLYNKYILRRWENDWFYKKWDK